MMDRAKLGQDRDVLVRLAALVERAGDAHTSGAEVRADAALFRLLFDEQYAFVWRSLLHLGVPEASVDDSVQEVFLIVHRRLESYDASLPLRAWLWGIARNVALNQRRALGRETRRRAALEAERGDSPEAAVDRARELRFVREILSSLEPALRDALVLSDVEGMTAPEIAAALDVNVNTVYSRVRIARQRFADLAQKRGHVPRGGSSDGL